MDFNKKSPRWPMKTIQYVEHSESRAKLSMGGLAEQQLNGLKEMIIRTRPHDFNEEPDIKIKFDVGVNTIGDSVIFFEIRRDDVRLMWVEVKIDYTRGDNISAYTECAGKVYNEVLRRLVDSLIQTKREETIDFGL